MARNVDGRLKNLSARRRGMDRLYRVGDSDRMVVVAKSFEQEPWQKRAGDAQYTRYALGAMEAVGEDYTRVSIETADRVANQLRQSLAAEGIAADFRLQGSVPLDIHIRGVSDVDLLTIDDTFVTYALAGQLSRPGRFTPSLNNSKSVLRRLRSAAERILPLRFPKATVDASGGKAVEISGGSLARPVDVVPCHWFDTINYQTTYAERDRGITIFDKNADETRDNWPFLHMHRIEAQCNSCAGGLRKAIRLCKNVKADAEEEGSTIELPSFDIASLMYHANTDFLRAGQLYELEILIETQRHLDALWNNKSAALGLAVPDGSRLILDSPKKMEGLLRLSCEIDDLLREVAKEQSSLLRDAVRRAGQEPSLGDSRAALNRVYVPAA